MDHPVSEGPTALECGQALQLRSGGGVTLTGNFPRVVSASEQTVTGTVEVVGETEGVRGVVTPGADAFLVREGRVATLPLPQDSVGMRLELGPGEVQELPANATLSPCDPAEGETAGSLQPGAYELFVRVVFNHDDGSVLESIGGPWPLEIR